MMMLLFLGAGVYPLSEGTHKMEIFHVVLAVGTYPRPGSTLPNFSF